MKNSLLPKLVSGDIVGTLAVTEDLFAPSKENIELSYNSGKINGKKIAVPDASIATHARVAKIVGRPPPASKNMRHVAASKVSRARSERAAGASARVGEKRRRRRRRRARLSHGRVRQMRAPRVGPSGLRNRSAAPRGRRRPPGPVRVSFAGADALHRAPDARDEPVTGPRVRVLSLACSLPRVSSGRDDERAFYGNSRRGACCDKASPGPYSWHDSIPHIIYYNWAPRGKDC